MNLSNENIVHVKKNGIEYIQFRKLLEYKNKINHVYTLGVDWNFRTSTADKKELPKNQYKKNIESYKNLCKELNMNYKNLVKPNQDHTDEVKLVKSKIEINKPDFDIKEYDRTDGLFTNKKDIILGTTNADCILLLFYDPIKDIIANIHSGWRGTLQRISVKTVEKMVKEFNCNPEDIICCICPSIRKCHFEVDKDVKDMFENEYRDLNLDEIIEEKVTNQKWNIDTILINKIILKEAGLKEKNIIDSKICSVCNSNKIHSYRVEKEGYGLNIALIEKI